MQITLETQFEAIPVEKCATYRGPNRLVSLFTSPVLHTQICQTACVKLFGHFLMSQYVSSYSASLSHSRNINPPVSQAKVPLSLLLSTQRCTV